MNITKHIPNTLTCLNVFSGCVACFMAIEGEIFLATLWIVIGAFFDFLDGFAARVFKAFSSIGKDLDSLADVVTFGMAPGMIVFRILKEAVPAIPSSSSLLDSSFSFIPFIAFIIPVLSALRLAKFNNDTRQADSFIGLPVPAHALFWSSLGCFLSPRVYEEPLFITIGVIVLVVISSIMLVSEIPMFSLKIKSIAWRGNELRYILITCSVAFILLWGIPGIAAAIIVYIILSIFNKKS